MVKKSPILAVIVLLLIVLGGCSKGPSPEERFQEYVSLWNKQKFNEMYDFLSADAKSKMTEKEFTDRYKKIYESVEVSNLNVTYDKPEEDADRGDEKKASLPYALKMETLAGPVEFEQDAVFVQEETEKEENWFLAWNPAMIFPQLKEGDAVRVTELKPLRGSIFDKNGKGIAIQAKVPEIQAVPGQLGDEPEKVKAEAAKLLNLSVEDIDAKLSANWVKPDVSVPIVKVDPANKELLIKVTSLPGFQKADVDSRYYPQGESSAHLSGYVGSITAEQLEKLKDKGYTSTSQIGKTGLEYVYEERLRGKPGYRIFIEASNETIAETPAENGEDITVTIDASLQKQLYDQLKGDSGTAVALHPKTGETLAMVSSPSYNPNAFVFGMSGAAYKTLAEHPQKPLSAKFNKTFSPGSTFKPITAAVGLKNGSIDPEAVKEINGLSWQKGPEWGKYTITRVSEKYSSVNLERALVTSDNIYFAQAALAIGPEAFNKGLEEFGFSEDIDYAFPIAASSVSNADLASNEVLLADSGYGQGEVLMSPVHLTAAYTVFLNEGSMLKPYLEKKEQPAPEIWKEGIISPEQNSIIYSDLVKVVEDPNGTAHKPKLPNIKLAGKTGTAELKTTKEEIGKENGWFVGMNTENPELLITMMIEDVKDRGGSHYVVPKVKNVFSSYLK
ncbi:penicillin-binding transpeptidase domain-containing protein [Metabacillus idriensis]|uniref:penicillin-binding transpeptidase domain-containing protein n=1 Tax=Metabacillus idriensis TaxID=324768 RepID=UPI0028146365|nr:penicillin-binding transpeptidase domain-containing protein [Metabacillus idriensis]MDR0136945.1 penicillin-binding transpeptidase domain-containing protein [Metabacillus idriensis]